MLKVAMLALGASLSIVAIAPQDAAAQLSGRTRSGQTIPTERRGDVITHETRNDDRCYDDRYDRNDRRYDRDDDDRDDRGRNPKKDGRHDNGKHKGWYKNGKADDCDWNRNDRNRNDRNRSMGTMSDVILRRPRYSGQTLSYSVLQQVMGNSALSRIDQARAQLGYNGPLTGRWYEGSAGSELNLYANGLQIVQILDRNRDGRVDVARWTNGR